MSEAPTFEIEVEPSGIVLSCQNGETIIECAWRHGFYWPTICGGNGECGACRCEIINHVENLGPEVDRETVLFRTVPRTSAAGFPVRFACCAVAHGPVTVRRKGVIRK